MAHLISNIRARKWLKRRPKAIGAISGFEDLGLLAFWSICARLSPERERIAKGIWRGMGACAGEYPHLGAFGLKAKEAGIGIVADHRVDEGDELPFFGKTKATTLSPARLALKTGADLVAIRVERLGPARFKTSAAGPASATTRRYRRDSAGAGHDDRVQRASGTMDSRAAGGLDVRQAGVLKGGVQAVPASPQGAAPARAGRQPGLWWCSLTRPFRPVFQTDQVKPC